MTENLVGSHTQGLHWVDWIVVLIFVAINLGIGIYFTKLASKNITSFFITGRSLGWFVAGISMIATAFANHTPIWVTTLIRRYGLYYIWQHWALAIGVALAAVLFARLWRRMAVVTDIEFLELRYSGKWASTLRCWEGSTQALLFCPLLISWTIKAMEIVFREAMGLPEEYRLWITIVVVGCSVIMCALSGLFGVVYAALLQFFVATIGMTILAFYAVNEVGGLTAMVEQLRAMESWPGHRLNIAPDIGFASHQMPIFNAIGYFGLLWMSSAVMGRHQAQRLLACKDARQASFGTLLFGVVYRCLICWPWIIVGACSILLIPNLGSKVMEDSAYPRMIVMLLPVGLRGLMVAAMVAAFVSTVGAMFTWGSSYMVNDVYKRFVVKNASDKHYVGASRIATIFLAISAGAIAFLAEDTLWLVTTAYVIWSGLVVVEVMRWMWWRQSGAGDLFAVMATWVCAPMLVLGVFDKPFQVVLGWLSMDQSWKLSKSFELLGARMMIAALLAACVSVVVSLCTKPASKEHLEKFVERARPFKKLWWPVIKGMGDRYKEAETISRTLLSWIIGGACMITMIFGIGKFLFGDPMVGSINFAVSIVLLFWIIARINTDFAKNKE